MSKYTNIEAIKNYVELARMNLIHLGFTELSETKIVVEWNTRAKNRLGQCCPKRLIDVNAILFLISTRNILKLEMIAMYRVQLFTRQPTVLTMD